MPGCECGRRLADAATRILHRSGRYFTYHLCACGIEWTTAELSDHELVDPVTGGEVLAVHERLAKFDGSMAELLEALNR